MRVLCASVLASEAIVIFFALLVAKDLSGVDDTIVFTVGGAGAVTCLVLAGALRHRWAYVAGSVVQVLVIAAGLVVPVMFALGVIFAALWVLAIYLGRRVANLQEARAALVADQPADRVPNRDDDGGT